MGYMRHHAIVVTSTHTGRLEAAHTQATATFRQVSEITPPAINGYRSFFVPPDGSKEGWTDSDAGDEARASFIAWIRENAYVDGGTYLTWAEVMYGDDEDQDELVGSSGMDLRQPDNDRDA